MIGRVPCGAILTYEHDRRPGHLVGGMTVVHGLCQNSPTMEPWALGRSGASGFTAPSGRPGRGFS
jgi:hypothetical protein